MGLKRLQLIILAFCLLPNFSISLEDLVMDATWEDGTINSGDPEINADPPLEERIYVASYGRDSNLSIAHQGGTDLIEKNAVVFIALTNSQD